MSEFNIGLAKPDIREEDFEDVLSVLRSGMLIQGKKVQEFERLSAEWGCSTRAVSSGTAALHVALLALGIQKGDEVIVPAFSFVASANSAEAAGAKAVFVDVDPDTFCLDTAQLDLAITSETKAIMPVHEFGLCANMPEIMRIAEKNNIPVIEDAACALGATIDGQFAGTWGAANCFSLHPRKIITSGEGGLVMSENEGLIQRIEQIRNHGISFADGIMEFVDAGLNYRLTDFQAALVIPQLKRLDKKLARHQEIANRYTNEIANSLIKVPVVPAGYTHTWQTFHVILDASLNRDETIKHLKSQGIGTNYGAQCIPDMKYYREKYNLDCQQNFPNALAAYKQGLALPLHSQMTDDEISYVIAAVNQLQP